MKSFCLFQFEFIILCFAVFAERILPISTAALLASELPLDYSIQRKKKMLTTQGWLEFLKIKFSIGSDRVILFHGLLSTDKAKVVSFIHHITLAVG